MLLKRKIARLHGLTEADVDHLLALLDACTGSILITGDRLLLAKPLAGNLVMTPAAWLRNATPKLPRPLLAGG